MTIQSEKALDNLTKCNADLRADIKHWHEQKDAELCQMMTQIADNYINYHQKVGTHNCWFIFCANELFFTS